MPKAEFMKESSFIACSSSQLDKHHFLKILLQ